MNACFDAAFSAFFPQEKLREQQGLCRAGDTSSI